MQLQKASSPINVTPAPIVTCFKFLQEENALLPIFFNLLGSFISVKLLHPLKALSPIFTTEFPNSIFFKFLQFKNALFPILLIFFPITISFTLSLPLKASSPTDVTLYVFPSIFTVAGIFIFAFFSFEPTYSTDNGELEN